MVMEKLSISFDQISEIGSNNLVGGFSFSYAIDENDSVGDDTTNNCVGGNCSSMCGSWQNIKCNSVVGCNG